LRAIACGGEPGGLADKKEPRNISDIPGPDSVLLRHRSFDGGDEYGSGLTAAVAILSAFFTRFGCFFTVIFEVAAALLAAFFTGFRGFFTVFCKIT